MFPVTDRNLHRGNTDTRSFPCYGFHYYHGILICDAIRWTYFASWIWPTSSRLVYINPLLSRLSASLFLFLSFLANKNLLSSSSLCLLFYCFFDPFTLCPLRFPLFSCMPCFFLSYWYFLPFLQSPSPDYAYHFYSLLSFTWSYFSHHLSLPFWLTIIRYDASLLIDYGPSPIPHLCTS